jgi:predicted Zn-dependent protease
MNKIQELESEIKQLKRKESIEAWAKWHEEGKKFLDSLIGKCFVRYSTGNTIFLFKDAMKNVSDTDESLIAMEISTILHEFAHLGGAEHIQNTGCIMADTVENLDFFTKIPSIRDSYCKEDLDAINKAL